MNEKVEGDMIIEVDPATLLPNPYQTRVTNSSDDELMESIRKIGLVELPIVRETPKGYQIATGHRRVGACIRAGLRTIRCILRVYTDEQMAVAAMEENLKRKSLNPVEEAKGYANLRDNFRYSEEKIAATFLSTRDHVAQSLRLLTFQQPIQDLVAQGQLTPSHAEAIAMAPGKRQLELTQTVLNKKLTVKKTTEMAKDYVNREKANQQAIENIAQRLEAQDTQIASLNQVLSRHESLLEFHGPGHEWKARDCLFASPEGLCRIFRWDHIPDSWAKRLEGIAQFKLVDGKAYLQACAAVCGHCTLYYSRSLSETIAEATQHKS